MIVLAMQIVLSSQVQEGAYDMSYQIVTDATAHMVSKASLLLRNGVSMKGIPAAWVMAIMQQWATHPSRPIETN